MLRVTRLKDTTKMAHFRRCRTAEYWSHPLHAQTRHLHNRLRRGWLRARPCLVAAGRIHTQRHLDLHRCPGCMGRSWLRTGKTRHIDVAALCSRVGPVCAGQGMLQVVAIFGEHSEAK